VTRAGPAPPEGAFAVVMATAVVARAVHSSLPLASRVLVWGSVVALVTVALLLVLAPRQRGRLWWDVATLAAGAAATGAGLVAAGWSTAGVALATVAIAAWACLLGMRAPWRAVRTDASGRRLLAVVATQSAVIAAALLGRSWDTGAFAGIAVALWLGAIVLYGAMIAPVLRGMSARAAETAFRADDWIAMGALAISALAAAELMRMPGVPLHPAVEAGGIATWSGAWLWVPTLVRLDARAMLAGGRGWPGAGRWSTVFPLGMLCAASQALGAAAGLPAFSRLGRDAAWGALAAWAMVAAGILAGQASRRYSPGGRSSDVESRSAIASEPSPAAETRAAASSTSSSARTG
jgi:Voltage-dependent anion channel